MFAYSIAAAHLELPHQLISSLMVSDIALGDAEGWPLVDAIPTPNVCERAKSLVQYPTNTTAIPFVVHMCQRYGLGSDWFFGKRAIPTDSIYECETPLFAEPPNHVATFNYQMLPPKFERRELSAQSSKRMAFILCYLYRLMNEATAFYKAGACSASDGTPPNLEKTRNLAEYMKQKGNHHKRQ